MSTVLPDQSNSPESRGFQLKPNLEHLEKLHEGLEGWNRWRLERPGICPNLSNSSLRRMHLEEVDFHGTHLWWADLSDAQLHGANLRASGLRGAILKRADLREADLTRAGLRESDLRYCDLRGADLRWAGLRGANLQHAKLRGANFKGAFLKGCFYGENVPMELEPLQLHWLPSPVLVLDRHLELAGHLYSFGTWLEFSDERIRALGPDILDVWQTYRDVIFSMIRASGREVPKMDL